MGRPDPFNGPVRPSPRLSRRGVLLLGGTAVVAAGAFAASWFNVLAENGADALSPAEVHAAVKTGEVVLIDIRRPDEWAATGIGEGAIPLDMRRQDFEAALLDVVSGDTSRPVALICARGVRSRHLSERLRTAGFTRILDVPEGMLGSGAGSGWIKSGLPVVAPR